MNILLAIYLFISAVVLLILAVITGRRRRTLPAGREFSLLAGCIALYVMFYALELTQAQPGVLKQVVRLEFLFAPYIPAFWVLFCFTWCGYGHLINRTVRAVLFSFSTLTMILAQTNDYHGLIFTRLWVDTTGAFPYLMAHLGPWLWVHIAYLNLCALINNIMLFRQFLNARSFQRRQTLIMLFASLVSWLTVIAYLAEWGPREIAPDPFGLSVAAMLFAWGVLRQHLLDVAPVARFTLVEMMHDPVMVFDHAGRMVDHNLAACRLLGHEEHHASGITRQDISRRAPELAEAIARAEQGDTGAFHYAQQVFSLSSTPLRAAEQKTLTLFQLHDITAQSRAEEARERLREDLENARIISQRDEERIAIARDLHDDLSQELSAIHIELASLSRTAADPETRVRLTGLKEQLGRTTGGVRTILAELRSEVLEQFGLKGAIEWLAGNLSRKCGITCRIAWCEPAVPLSPEATNAVYRIIQEALNNIARHSRAAEAQIAASCRPDSFAVTVSDNGTGFDVQCCDTEHYGIAGMQERARLLGGSLVIESTPGRGTGITLDVPLKGKK